MNMKYSLYVGMDVHARSISARAVNPETGETWSTTLAGDGLDERVCEWVSGLPGGDDACCAYESGPTGFHTARYLRERGVRCVVMAVSTIARSARERARKNDRNDARAVLGELTSVERRYSEVWVPSPEEEAARHVTRACHEAAEDLKRAKQQAESYILLYGHAWNELTPSGRRKGTWTRDYLAWIKKLDLGSEAANALLAHKVECVEARKREYEELRRMEEEASRSEPLRGYVDALTLLQGVGTHCATMFAADVGDPERFPGGRKVAAALGLVPSEHTTSDSRRVGPITKAGHSRLRRCVIEGDAAISLRGGARKAPRKGAEVPPAVREAAASINRRLKGRYDDLVAKGKQPNVARTAVAREKVQAMWALMLMVRRGRPAA